MNYQQRGSHRPRRETMTDNLQQNRDGDWVPAIPLPFLGLRKRCWSCGAKFWTRRGYEGHYALIHILKLKESR